MTPKKPEITRPLTERLTELTSDLRRTQELAKGGLLPLERRSLAMLEELGLLHCRKEDAAVLPQEQAAFEAFGAAWARLRSVEEAVRAGDGPSSTHFSAIQEMQVQARELKVVLNAPALARAEAAEAREAIRAEQLRRIESVKRFAAEQAARHIGREYHDIMAALDLVLRMPLYHPETGGTLSVEESLALAGSPS